MALIVSVSGVRGIVGTELTPDVVAAFAAAFGSLYRGRIAVGRDSRPSGETLRLAVRSGLMAVGCDVEDIGILPTPSLGFCVRERGCQGGVQITASHNPSPYNGLKLFGPDGAVLTAAEGERVRVEYQQSGVRGQGTRLRGQHSPPHHLTTSPPGEAHIQRVLQLVDVDAIRRARFQIILDANGGAGGPLGLTLLRSLGCRVMPVACEPDGDFRHEPEPTPASLGAIEEMVRQHPGSIGAALDPDADRLVLIDDSGRCLSEEWTLALAVKRRLAKERGHPPLLRGGEGGVVINLSTSRTTEDVARSAGVPCARSAVGEANVVAKMRELNALVGGEGNGGVIDPRVGWVRDPFIGLALILETMADDGVTLRELAELLPRYVMVKEKHDLPGDLLGPALDRMATHWPDAKANRIDGLRLDWPDRWLHVRGSNTEPIVRVIAEGLDHNSVKSLCAEAWRLLRSNDTA